MKIHLISYGDEHYTSQIEFFKETAIASSFFDDIKVYGTEIIDNDFYARFQTLLNYPKGGGYYIWKPYLIKKILDNLPDGDILIYCDAGSMINIAAKECMDEYINVLVKSATGSIAFELPHLEIEYTKKEVFDYFNTPLNIINSAQLIGGILLIKKCKHTTLLVDKWIDTLYQNPLLFAEDKDVKHQYRQFIKHKHDQSIFSIIRKTYGSEIIPDQTFFQDFIREGQAYPFWATRLR